MSSFMTTFGLNPVTAAGLFSTLGTGGDNLRNQWDTVAKFGGALVIMVAVIFLCIAVMKQRDKSRWWWATGIAFTVGAILLIAGSVNSIQGDLSDTWHEVFGFINLVSTFGFPGF